MILAIALQNIARGSVPGPLKTEAVVLRSMRYGEADRILHVYTPMRGRVSAIAKGVRRARSRFGGRLEPFFRLSLGLHEGRSDLLTVTSAETIEPHKHLREDAASLDGAARACDAVARMFDSSEPHPEVFHLLCSYLALLDAEPRARRRPPGSWRSGSSCCWRPASRRSSPRARRAARRPPRRLLGDGGRRRVRRAARRRRSRSTRRRTSS